MRYKLVADRKRALISRLLQWRCATVALDIPYDDIVIKRTKATPLARLQPNRDLG